MTYYLKINKLFVDNYKLIFSVNGYSYSFLDIKIIFEILNNLIILNCNCNFFFLFETTIRKFVVLITPDF